MSLPVRSANEIVTAIAAGELSAVDGTRQTLATIDQENESLNAFISVSGESAIAAAEAIDADRAAGKPLGPLAGLPIAIKDGICTAGQRTTAGSNMLHDFVPPYDATIVSRLRAAGAICIGKANMDEFAMGSSTENSFFGVTKNPYSANHVAGGSSGGSAACVGAGAGFLFDWLRHRWIDPAAGGILRHHGTQANLRTGQPVRPDRVCQFARPDRPDGGICSRRRAHHTNDCRP